MATVAVDGWLDGGVFGERRRKCGAVWRRKKLS
jgi:hypothetical protein